MERQLQHRPDSHRELQPEDNNLPGEPDHANARQESRVVGVGELAMPEATDDAHTEAGVPDNLLNIYLRQIGRIPLLEVAQEVELAKQIEAGLYAGKLLALHEQTHAETGQGYLAEDMCAELQLIESEGKLAKERFILANLRLVVKKVKKYTRSNVPLADLIQAGNLGLVRAVEKFDYTKGWRFSTYASFWILDEAIRFAAEEKYPLVSVKVAKSLGTLQRASRNLEDTGQPVSVEALANLTDMPPRVVAELLMCDHELWSMNRPSHPGSQRTLEDELSMQANNSEAPAAVSRFMTELPALLSEKEYEVMTLFFGLDGIYGRTMLEVAENTDVTIEEARLHVRRIRKKIRQWFKERNIDPGTSLAHEHTA